MRSDLFALGDLGHVQEHNQILADFRELASKTASVENLQCSGYFGEASISAGISYPFLLARQPLKLLDFGATVLADVAASDTNYWTFTIRRYSGGSFQGDVAVKTTKVTGGEAMLAQKDWNFDMVSLALQTAAKGDLFTFVMVPTGTPTALNRLGFSCRYLPLA